MPGGGDPIGGVVRAKDDGRGTLLLRVSEGTGAVQGVWGGDGGWIIGGVLVDTTWASSIGEMELENLVHGGRTMDVPHVLPSQGRPAEMSVGGIHRISGDEDSDAGTFSATAFPGHRGHFGRVKPLPPTVPLMQNYGPLAYTERKAP